jgi:hypothetical protein
MATLYGIPLSERVRWLSKLWLGFCIRRMAVHFKCAEASLASFDLMKHGSLGAILVRKCTNSYAKLGKEPTKIGFTARE